MIPLRKIRRFPFGRFPFAPAPTKRKSSPESTCRLAFRNEWLCVRPTRCFIILLCALTAGVQAKSVAWRGVASELWKEAENWEGDALPDGKDIAQFGPQATNMNVRLNGGNRQVETVEFLPQALPYVISGGNDLQAAGIRIPAGVDTDQSIEAPLRCISVIEVEHNGTASLLLKAICSHTGPAHRPATLRITGSGNGAIDSLVAPTRAQNLAMAGSGTWSITGTMQFRINDAKQAYSLITVDSGTLDISAMTLDFLGTTESQATNLSYVLVDYSTGSGKLIVAPGATPVAEVRNLPSGYTILHDTAARKILLIAGSAGKKD